MVLDTPEVAEANLLRQSYLFQNLVKDFRLALPMLQGAVNLNLVKDPEVHCALPGLTRVRPQNAAWVHPQCSEQRERSRRACAEDALPTNVCSRTDLRLRRWYWLLDPEALASFVKTTHRHFLYYRIMARFSRVHFSYCPDEPRSRRRCGFDEGPRIVLPDAPELSQTDVGTTATTSGLRSFPDVD